MALDDLIQGRLGQAPKDDPPPLPSEPAPVKVAVLLGPFHRPEWMAWALDQLGVSGRCVKAGRLSLALLDDPDEAGWLQAAADLSAALVFSQVLAIRRGPSEDPMASDMQAFGFSDGEKIRTFPPGLLLATLEGPAEELLLDPDGSAGLMKNAVATYRNKWQPRLKSLDTWWRREVIAPGDADPTGFRGYGGPVEPGGSSGPVRPGG